MRALILALVLLSPPGLIQAEDPGPLAGVDVEAVLQKGQQDSGLSQKEWDESIPHVVGAVTRVFDIKEPTREKIIETIETIKAEYKDDRKRAAIEKTLLVVMGEIKKSRQQAMAGGDGAYVPLRPMRAHGQPAPISPAAVRNVLIRDMMAAYPEDPYAFAEGAKDDFESRDYAGSFQKWGRVIELGQRDPDTLTGYGGAAYHLGDTRLAARSASLALKAAPRHRGAVALLKLSESRVSRIQLPNVLDAADKASVNGLEFSAASGPDAAVSMASARMTPAQVAAQAQRQANAPASNARQSASATQEAAKSLGVRDFSQAHAMSTRAIELDPRNAQAWNFRAIAANRLGRYDDALYDSSFSLGLAPGNAAALQTRSWALSKLGKYREALADANYTLEKEPENSYAYYNRAFAQAGLGDRDGAVDSIQKAARLDARFQETFQQAVQAPRGADLLFLFNDVGSREPGGASGRRRGRLARFLLLSLMGGVLTALGLLHIFSSSWREKVRTTVRRLAGAGAPKAAGGDGFWSGYTVIRQIGSGGMGVVYEAADNALSRRVAIKKMRDEIRADPRERELFLIEARIVAALRHPNIVDIHSIVEDGGDVYLVFEYVDGRTVAELLRERGPLQFPRALCVMKDACAAVEYAHRQRIIHRDIKNSNIMIASDGRVKVMDFGVARRAKEAATRTAHTRSIVGTPPYMAPEQEQGTVRSESDVFSLAVCFYEMVSGRLPFPGEGAGMLLNKINAQHYLLSHAVSGLPSGIDAVMAKALHPDPEKRFRTPDDFSRGLQGLEG